MERKEAIKVVRNIYQTDAEKEALETLIPELAESEDERIRKEIISFIEYEEALGNIPDGWHQAKRPVKWIAYLEKQKVTAAIPDELVECYKNLCEIGNRGVASFINAINGINEQKEQKPEEGREYSCPDCGTTSVCTNDESEGDKRYREGVRYALQQTEDYTIGKTFKGLIPCWVNAPSELQPAHKYHGKNVVIMHENNGGFRCVCVDDEKPVTFHLPEDTLFVEGWRKPTDRFEEAREKYQVEWSEEDEKTLWGLTAYIPNEELERLGVTRDDILKKLKSLRPQPIQLKEAYKEGFQTARHATALTFMNYLDENRPEGKMSLSSGECENIDKAFKENDWTKILRYAEKYGKKN